MQTTSLRGLIENVSKADPQSWLYFFNQYGIRPEDVDLEKELRRAYRQHGRRFSNELNRLLIQHSERVAAFTGSDARSVVNSVFDILGISATGDSTQTAAQKEEQKRIEEELAQAEREEKQRKQRMIIGGFVALVVLAIGTLVAFKIFKK